MSTKFIDTPLLREIKLMKNFEMIWRNSDRLQAVRHTVDRNVRDEYVRTLKMDKDIARDQILSRMAVLCHDFLEKYNDARISHELDREDIMNHLCEDLMKVLDVIRHSK